MRFSKAYLGSALLLGAAMVASCAEERSVRNTVQPNIVRKADLTGTWYYAPTVIDVPYGTATTFIGEQAMDLDKIVWDIQEDILYARRAYEQVKNTDNSLKQGGIVGQPVGAWRIQSQFDIIRDYNSATGEESNTIRETGERPWYEREFIRVDWSANLADNWGFTVDKVQTAPINYFVTDPNSPEALRFERRQVPGQNNANVTEVGYIDITNKLFVSPETVYYEGYGYIPMCWFNGNQDDCTAQEIKLRHSFLKLDPTRDYAPQIWTDKDQERFGFFDVERRTYNRQYGVTDSGKVRMARRFNLWVDHHVRNADGSFELDADGNKVVKPEQERTARQLTYWANPTYPAELQDAGAEIVKGWSLAFWNVVDHYNQVAGGSMQIQLKSGQKVALGSNDETPMILWCGQNPTTATSPAGCIADAGGVGKLVREGDLRYNMIAWVDKPQRGGPLGYGPMPADPETGETIHASAFIYGAGLDTYSSWSRDIILLLNNELTVAQITDGKNVHDSVTANFEGLRSHETAVDPAHNPYDYMDFSWVPKADSGARAPQNPRDANDIFVRGQKKVMDSGVLGPGFDIGRARLSAASGSAVEGLLMSDPEWRMQAADVYARHGVNPFTDVASLSAEVRRQVSPLTLLSSTTRRMQNDRMIMQAHRAMDMADFGEESALGLAKEFKAKYDLKTEEGRHNLWKDVRVAIYRGVTEHEMGHNMGLRHNFEGTIDSMNYFKKYWDLRIAANGGNKATLKQRFEVSPTQAEIDGKINEYQYSTVMDYGAKFNSDIQGLGKYDFAALKFAYGDLLEVFNETNPVNIGKISDISEYQSFGWPTALDQTGGTLKAINYTQFPTLADLESRTNVHRSTIRTDIDGNLAFTERDGMRRAVVPYRFCSDEFAGGTETCARYDEGADIYEIGNDYIKRYKSYYIFNAFKRDRWGWEGAGYQSRIMQRYLEPIQSQYKSIVRYRASLEAQVDPAVVAPLFTDAAGWKGWGLSAEAGLNLFGEIITAPEAGSFIREVNPVGLSYLKQDSDSMGSGVKSIPLIDGRYFSTTWDFDSGYYWYEHQTRIGFAIDKQVATYLLAEASANYLGADTFADVRRFAINYSTTYSKQLKNTFSSTITEDMAAVAPIVDMTSNGMDPIKYATVTTVAPRPLLANKAYVDPTMTFTTRLVTQFYGLSMYRNTFDNSFNDESRIFLDGNGEAISFPAGQRKTFVDPESGRTYVAWDAPASSHPSNSIGARLLAYAERLRTTRDSFTGANAAETTKVRELARVELRLFLQQLDLQRTMVTMFDKAGDF